MILTIEKVRKMEACVEAIEWAEPIYGEREIESIPVLKVLIENKKFAWANWLIVRVMEKKQYVKYAIFAAEQVLDIYEKKYPDDDRPRKAIEAAKNALKENFSDAASDAAYAAYASSYAAPNAADAAAYAAYAAAYASSHASNATTSDAADAAAAYAVYASSNAADAKEKMKIKILRYGIKLLEAQDE